MNRHISVLVVILFAIGGFNLALGSQNTEKHQGFLSVFPDGRRPEGCSPAEVIGISNAARPPNGTEVTIKSFASKPITSIRFGWHVFSNLDEWSKVSQLPCNATTNEQPVLVGESTLIKLGHLNQGQTCTIGKAPLKIGRPADMTVLLEKPFWSFENFRALTTEDNSNTFRQGYSVMLLVSEVTYDDGSVWKAKGFGRTN